MTLEESKPDFVKLCDRKYASDVNDVFFTFSERCKLVESYEQWVEANSVNECSFSVITWLNSLGMLRKVPQPNLYDELKKSESSDDTYNYKVITLCGSTKFKKEFIEVQKRLTLNGAIVISLGLFGHSGDEEVLTDETREMFTNMHKQKIDMADEIFVIDVDGYVGEATRSEILYAIQKGKIVRFYSSKDKWFDEVGGFHDCGVGHNPNGVLCGECNIETCSECHFKNLVKAPTEFMTKELQVPKE